MKEFNHRCAICGADRPQIHHLDEDPSNNDEFNLLPICPNCHLSDQHDPTRRIDPGQLMLFRKYKDPAILKPQFYPLFLRMKFLQQLPNVYGAGAAKERATELVEFIKALEMGNFYAGRIEKLVKFKKLALLYTGDEELSRRNAERIRENEDHYIIQLLNARDEVEELIVELLRYQNWPPIQTTSS